MRRKAAEIEARRKANKMKKTAAGPSWSPEQEIDDTHRKWLAKFVGEKTKEKEAEKEVEMVDGQEKTVKVELPGFSEFTAATGLSA